MNEQIQVTNVQENAVLYDTVLVSQAVPGFYPTAQWFANLAGVANANELPFFNIRNESMVGHQYCNMDSIDKMSFPFLLRSIGVQVFALPSVSKTNPDQDWHTDEQSEAASLLWWSQELVKHMSLILKVNQDEKLVANVSCLPSGVGVWGDADTKSELIYNSAMCNWGNGVKDISNRFIFPEPVEIPRNQTISCKLELSPIAKNWLRRLNGPSTVTLNDDETGILADPPWNGNTYPTVYGIRVSLEGLRYVQQRGALHY